MILKYHEIKKLKKNQFRLILLYGKNESLKKQTLNIISDNQINFYEEKDVLGNLNIFFENLYSKSLFEKSKTIVVKRATDKILPVIEEIQKKDIDDNLILISDNLEKKSKLRNFFEKKKKTLCIPFYADNDQTLLNIANNYFKEKKIKISQSNINLIINKCQGDRGNLENELEKVMLFLKSKKEITSQNIIKLINISENYNTSELIDNCLAKNKKKVIHILNENNYTNDDYIIILRSFLNKAKRILNLSLIYNENNNLDLTIANSKPPIFWKDKEIVKQQLMKWNLNEIKKLIFEINLLELRVKKNLGNGLNLITDFLLEQASLKN